MPERFEQCTYHNRSTLFTVVNALYQGHDQVNNPPPEGYVSNTGVIVLTTNLGPNSSATSQVPAQINCLATRVQCNMRWRRNSNGEEGSHTHEDKVAPEGQYLRAASFGIRDASTAAGDEPEY